MPAEGVWVQPVEAQNALHPNSMHLRRVLLVFAPFYSNFYCVSLSVWICFYCFSVECVARIHFLELCTMPWSVITTMWPHLHQCWCWLYPLTVYLPDPPVSIFLFLPSVYLLGPLIWEKALAFLVEILFSVSISVVLTDFVSMFPY